MLISKCCLLSYSIWQHWFYPQKTVLVFNSKSSTVKKSLICKRQQRITSQQTQAASYKVVLFQLQKSWTVHLLRIISNSTARWGGIFLFQKDRKHYSRYPNYTVNGIWLRDTCKSRVPLCGVLLGRTARIFNKQGKLSRTLVLLPPLPALQAAIQIDSKTEDRLPLWKSELLTWDFP